MVVTIADRECDIYEFLLEAQLRNAKYVIRAAHNRHVLDSEYKYTHEYVRASPVRGQIEVTVPVQQRTAAVHVRFSAITLCAPERLTKSKNKFNVSCWVSMLKRCNHRQQLKRYHGRYLQIFLLPRENTRWSESHGIDVDGPSKSFIRFSSLVAWSKKA